MNINKIRLVIVCGAICLLPGYSKAYAGVGHQLGVGYGKEFRGNTDLSQIELYYRMPLSYQKDLGEVWKLSTDVEFAGAIIDDNDSETSSTGRLSLMPQMVLCPNDSVHFLFGVGLGFMMGETNFYDHNLGGPFFLSAKFGIQCILWDHLGLEYNFYHQSNAGIYEYNASLNMNYVGLSYTF